jgi:hypothetical protein
VSSDECRAKAAECEERAKYVYDPEIKNRTRSWHASGTHEPSELKSPGGGGLLRRPARWARSHPLWSSFCT